MLLKLLADPWSSVVELLPEATSRGIGSTLCHPAGRGWRSSEKMVRRFLSRSRQMPVSGWQNCLVLYVDGRLTTFCSPSTLSCRGLKPCCSLGKQTIDRYGESFSVPHVATSHVPLLADSFPNSASSSKYYTSKQGTTQACK